MKLDGLFVGRQHPIAVFLQHFHLVVLCVSVAIGYLDIDGSSAFLLINLLIDNLIALHPTLLVGLLTYFLKHSGHSFFLLFGSTGQIHVAFVVFGFQALNGSLGHTLRGIVVTAAT